MKKIIAILVFAFTIISVSAQQNFTEQDTLRGSITPERAWWDLKYYHLDIEVKPDEKFIFGKNTIRYTVLEENQVMQIDLQPPMNIEKITQNGKELAFKSNINAHLVKLKKKQKKGAVNEIVVHYSGHPKEAVRAPWDGGFSWKKDSNGKHFIATSCQGLGASVWWPCKDHMYDEVESMDMSVTVPKDLVDVSNGRLVKVDEGKTTNTYHWAVKNPINNYGVNVNIGDYVNFGEKYAGEKGELDMDYYVLRENLEKAKEQFKQVPMMMKAFEHWFGPYPFYEDSFKLVEVPYLGMEHQSSVTYGNKYGNGYLGRDLSGSGWGMKFDYIIIHEAGHEWFANNITDIDTADMWIHESFTTYSENLYVDYHYGKEASADYVVGMRRGIRNKKPIIGPYNVNKRGADLYNKGANVIHTIRQLIEDDEKWRQILRGLNKDFYHQTVNTKQIEDYISKKSGIDLTKFFNQYLRDARIPTIEYKLEQNEFKFRYINIVDGFDMPVKVKLGNTEKWIFPKAEWNSEALPSNASSVVFDRNFYVNNKRLN